jgi:UDP-glucose 4-epimerase
MDSIVISGYNGFIGSSLTSRLNKFKIIGISDKKSKNVKNVTPIIKSVNKINSTDVKYSFQTLVHLAAVSDVSFCNNNPEICYEVNVNGTAKMLEIARKNDANIIFTSSSHIYENPIKLPIKENDKINPSSVYSSSKIMAETLCETYAKIYGLNITVLRLFSIYGPNSPQHNLILNIIKQIKTKQVISLGNINTKRDFIHIDDVTDAFYRVVRSQKKGFNVYNICTNKSTSIKEICKKLIKHNKTKVPIVSSKNKLRKNDIPEIRGNFLKFKKDYEWNPKIKLEQGLKTTFNK